MSNFPFRHAEFQRLFEPAKGAGQPAYSDQQA